MTDENSAEWVAEGADQAARDDYVDWLGHKALQRNKAQAFASTLIAPVSDEDWLTLGQILLDMEN